MLQDGEICCNNIRTYEDKNPNKRKKPPLPQWLLLLLFLCSRIAAFEKITISLEAEGGKAQSQAQSHGHTGAATRSWPQANAHMHPSSHRKG